MQAPLLRMVARVGIAADSTAQARKLLGRVWNTFHGENATGVRLRRRLLPGSLVAKRVVNRTFPVTQWPLILNSAESAGLLGLPVGGKLLPGLSVGRARQLPPTPGMPTQGTVVGLSNYPGMASRPLALHTIDRLRHLHLIAPTGAGKSTLIANMVLQDIAHGYGVIVIDPKGGLDEIIARIPDDRLADLVVLDPSATRDHVVGFNPLNVAAYGSGARELVADHVLGIFHSIYRDFWGPRTDEVLRAALFSLTHTKAPDGSAFTLLEAVDLLTNPALRRYVATRPTLPDHLRLFWQQFDALSDDARAQVIGPVLNKLRAFSMRTPVRLLLGQSRGVQLDAPFARRSILLVSLAKGQLGSEVSNLLGSLLVSAIWQQTLARVRIPAAKRRPVFAYFDEFQDIVRLGGGLELADALAQARSLGLGFTLSHQFMKQLPEAVQDAVLGTVRSQLAFQVDYADGQLLARRYAPLTVDDLTGLSRYEFALRPAVNGVTLRPVTGTTIALPVTNEDAAARATASRTRFGIPRQDVEQAIQARTQITREAGPIGRRMRGGQP